jgi:hypothetical protein
LSHRRADLVDRKAISRERKSIPRFQFPSQYVVGLINNLKTATAVSGSHEMHRASGGVELCCMLFLARKRALAVLESDHHGCTPGPTLNYRSMRGYPWAPRYLKFV